MKYDVLLTHIGNDELAVAQAVTNTIQQLVPFSLAVNLNRVRDWLAHLPVLLRRGVEGHEARDLQQRFERIGAALAIIPSQRFFPSQSDDFTEWRNEWFSSHLIALHERDLREWAHDANIVEGYRFSLFPSMAADLTMRIWSDGETVYANARRSIGRLGPLPGPPVHEVVWSPTETDWNDLREMMKSHRFWESDSWHTVPEGYMVLDGNHWVVEGWRSEQYHALADQTPNEGAAREVGLLLIDLLPSDFVRPRVE